MNFNRTGIFRISLICLVIGLLALAGPAPAASSAAQPNQRYIIRTSGAADYAASHAALARAGGQFILDRPDLNLMAVSLSPTGQTLALPDRRGAAISLDQAETLAAPGAATVQRISLPSRGTASASSAPHVTVSVTPDPAFSLPGLLWDLNQINAPQTWQKPVGLGAGYVLVGVIDTGLDYTHLELRNKVVRSVDFTTTDDPNLCQTQFALPTDAQLAVAFAAPGADIDFNGHGTEVGGIIAARINQTGTNGIAPAVSLASLKVAQNCGVAYDSDILSAILYAADNGIDVVTVTFSHYLNRSDPAQDVLYQAYTQVVAYALAHGTVVVSGAGDEHVRIGPGGQVIGHGALSVPPGGSDDFGQWQIPGGIPGVVDVSATNNLVNSSSSTCPSDSLAAGTHQWCKLSSDAHQPGGAGRRNQLSYYSNYGTRIDLAAPGGARKFNLPNIDRGGAEGWPWTGINSVEGGTSVADGYSAWDVFNITSDFATEVPCFTFIGDLVFPSNQCYAIQEGTSLAAAHVAAAAAVAASAVPSLWRRPDQLISFIKTHTSLSPANATAPLSASDTTAGDSSGVPCTNGYCHLGGAAISNAEAYGAGLLDDSGPFWPKTFLPFAVK